MRASGDGAAALEKKRARRNFGDRCGSGSLCIWSALVPEVRMEDMNSGVGRECGRRRLAADGALVG